MNKLYNKKTAWAFLAIPLSFLTVFTFGPAIAALVLSFTDYDVFTPVGFVGLKNYAKVFASPMFRTALKNTVYFWIMVTPFLVIVPIFLAILVNNKLKGAKFFQLIYYFPTLVSVIVTGILWRWMFAKEGIMNYFLSLIGIDAVGWLTNPNTALPALALVTIWKGMGYYMLFYLAALQSVPKELYEAAEIDGASFWEKHLNITLPTIMPTVFFITVISTMGAFKEFALMLTMTKGGPVNSTKTLVYMIYEEAFTKLNMGYASAISMVLFIILLGLTIINQKFLDKDLSK